MAGDHGGGAADIVEGHAHGRTSGRSSGDCSRSRPSRHIARPATAGRNRHSDRRPDCRTGRRRSRSGSGRAPPGRRWRAGWRHGCRRNGRPSHPPPADSRGSACSCRRPRAEPDRTIRRAAGCATGTHWGNARDGHRPSATGCGRRHRPRSARPWLGYGQGGYRRRNPRSPASSDRRRAPRRDRPSGLRREAGHPRTRHPQNSCRGGYRASHGRGRAARR